MSNWLEELLDRQRPQLFLWVPVCLGLGIGLYFSVRTEPRLPLALVLPLIGFGFFLAFRSRHQGIRIVLAGVLLVASGLCLGVIRTQMVAAPVLTAPFSGAVEGRIVKIDRSATNRLRVTLDQVMLFGREPGETPDRVRVTVAGAAVPFAFGGRVLVQARLSGPGGPAEPGGFDFRRMAWFQRLGAIGYATGPILRSGRLGEIGTWHRIMALRMDAAAAIRRAIPGSRGAFAAAILTGDRSEIDQKQLADLRASNLAHLLAISGLHMGLLTGIVFAIARIGLVLMPGLPLRYPIKKWAAVAAIAAGGAYLLMSGANVATQRAFVMVAVIFAAILLDRPALTLRAVALAAIIILALRPESLVEAGFQMSFAATVALVAVFNFLRFTDWKPGGGPLRRALHWALTLVISSAVAGAATAPFSAFHFNQVAQYGLLANLISVPLMGLVVMPAAVAAIILAPVGLETLGFWVMGQGIGAILAVAGWVAALDGAVLRVPMPGGTVMPFLALGALILVLWVGWGRSVGIALLCIALVLWNQTSRPVFLIGDKARLFGVAGADGRALNRASGSRFVATEWLRNDGDGVSQAEASARAGIVETALGSQAEAQGVRLMFMEPKAGGLDLACKDYDVVVKPGRGREPAPPGCRLITPATLLQTGSLAFHASDKGVRQVTANDIAGRRPWTGYAPTSRSHP